MRRIFFSAVVENPQYRAAGLCSISADLDRGNVLTLKAYETEIKALSKQVNDYNEIRWIVSILGTTLSDLMM